MKQKDITLIVVAVFVSAVFSLVISNLLLSPSGDQKQQVEVVDPITADFSDLDARYFNSKSIDPTETIQIGDNANPQPFNSSN